MDAVRVLGEFHPSALQSEIIETEIKSHLPPCCRAERVSVRVPHERAQPAHPDNLEWHQDGGGIAGTVRHMIVWSTEQPTQIKLPNGITITPKPYQLVWYDNDHVHHRQQAGTDETRRWFVSIRCAGLNQEMKWPARQTPAMVAGTTAEQLPEGIFQNPADGGYYIKVSLSDGVIKNVRICEDCAQPMPAYKDFKNGLVSPESDGDAQGNGAKFRIGHYHENPHTIFPLQKIVCLPCYFEAFKRCYPGAPLPELNGDYVGMSDSTVTSDILLRNETTAEQLDAPDPTRGEFTMFGKQYAHQR